MMNRDDVLRELELLPAWKLRVPIEAKQVQQVAVEKSEAVQVESAFEKPDIEKPSTAAAIQYEITLSEDIHWVFICETALPETRMDIGLQDTLFKNILHALSIEKHSKMPLKSIADVQASMIVAMGESVAQALLNTRQPLETLRGMLHPIGHAQLVVTYDIVHLLNNPLDKAKVWQDLCLASSYLQGLQVQN